MISLFAIAALQAALQASPVEGDRREVGFSGMVRIQVDFPAELGRPGMDYYRCLGGELGRNRAALRTDSKSQVAVAPSPEAMAAAKANCAAQRQAAAKEGEAYLARAGKPEKDRAARAEKILTDYEMSLPAHFQQVSQQIMDHLRTTPPTGATVPPVRVAAMNGMQVSGIEQMMGLLQYSTCLRAELGTVNADRATAVAAIERAGARCRHTVRTSRPVMDFPGALAPKDYLRMRLALADRVDAYLIPIILAAPASSKSMIDRMTLHMSDPHGRVISLDPKVGVPMELPDSGTFFVKIDGDGQTGSAK